MGAGISGSKIQRSLLFSTATFLILAALFTGAPAYAEERGIFKGYDPRPGLSTEGAWSWQDYPFWVPHAEPLAVKVVEGFRAEDFQGPVSFTFTTPTGEFSRIILRVDVELVSAVEGRPAVQYDRPLWIWINGVPAFVGTTTQRYNYVAFSDVTHLYPLLVGGGEAELTIALPNWVIPDLGLTGVFVVDVTILYYPGSKPKWVPDVIMPLFAASDRSPWEGVAAARLTGSENVASESFKLPEGAARVFLLVYLEGASYDEFWYASIPAPRVFVFKADGKPFAVIAPYPQMYTGSLNPLLWRPLPGVRTLSFDPILVDVTGMLGALSQASSIQVEAVGARDYWWVFSALLVYIDDRVTGYSQVELNYEAPTIGGDGLAGEATGSYVFIERYRLRGATEIVLNVFGIPVKAYAYSLASIEVRGSHDFTEDTSAIELTVSSTYFALVDSALPGPSVWYRLSEVSTAIDYEFIVEPEGDPAEATPDNPVPAKFRLYTSVSQNLRFEAVWPFTDSYRALSVASAAESLIAGDLIFIGPTAAIITGITEAWGAHSKTVEARESIATPEGFPGPAIIEFRRETVAGNKWPEWWIERDEILIAWP